MVDKHFYKVTITLLHILHFTSHFTSDRVCEIRVASLPVSSSADVTASNSPFEIKTRTKGQRTLGLLVPRPTSVSTPSRHFLFKIGFSPK